MLYYLAQHWQDTISGLALFNYLTLPSVPGILQALNFQLGLRAGFLQRGMRPVMANRLAELEAVEPLDQHRPEHEREDQRRENAEHAAKR